MIRNGRLEQFFRDLKLQSDDSWHIEDQSENDDNDDGISDTVMSSHQVATFLSKCDPFEHFCSGLNRLFETIRKGIEAEIHVRHSKMPPRTYVIDPELVSEDANLTNSQTTSTLASLNNDSPDNKSSTTLGSFSDSGITTSESTVDDLSEPSLDSSNNFEDEINEVVDDGLIGLSDTALLALQENAHLDQDLIHPLHHQERLRKLLTTVCKGSVAAISEASSEMMSSNGRSAMGPLNDKSDSPDRMLQQPVQPRLNLSY
jgi:hypothetical protein